MLMRCIQVPNAVKDNISPVIKKKKKESSPCEEGRGERSETNKSENQYTHRYKR